MKDLQSYALRALENNYNEISLKGLIDLSVVSQKKVALLISKNQYIDLLGSFGLFLNQILFENNSLRILAPSLME